MIKILAVGNSFSQDATALIDFLTEDMYVRNLYFPSCTLEQHCQFFKEGKREYEYQHNGGNSRKEKVSLEEALSFEKWDYITIQQASGYSGRKDSYQPYMDELIAFIKARSDAEILFHQTWTYEGTSDHPHFPFYDKDKDKMWACVKAVSEEVCKERNLRMICAGKAIYGLGKKDFFNLDKGGISLYRDTFHLNVNYGRFIAACVWIKFFTGKLPVYLQREGLEEGYALIKEYLQ